MVRHGSRGLLALLGAGAALLVIIGLAVAATTGGGDGDGNGAIAASATPGPTSTIAVPTIGPTRQAPTATPSPDAPVSSPPLPPPVTPAPTTIPTPVTGTTTLPISNLTPLPAGTHRVDAPIDGLDMLTLESFPPQYLLHIEAGLPSGCAKQAGYEASRSGSVITVKVHNSLPDGVLACTAIYGVYELNINLGSDYTPGQTYTVRVNDKTVTFTAQ